MQLRNRRSSCDGKDSKENLFLLGFVSASFVSRSISDGIQALEAILHHLSLTRPRPNRLPIGRSFMNHHLRVRASTELAGSNTCLVRGKVGTLAQVSATGE